MTTSTSPKWIQQVARSWNAGTHGVYIIHGNIFDLFALTPNEGDSGVPKYVNLKSALTQRIFPKRDMLLFFDISDGITFATSGMQTKFMKWFQLYCETLNVAPKLPQDFVSAFKVVRAYNNQLDETEQGAVLIVDFAEKIIPAPSHSHSETEKMAEVALLKFAALNAQRDAGVFLITESTANLSESLTNNPYVTQIRLDMPELEERVQFLESQHTKDQLGGMSAEDVAARTAGLNLRRIQNLITWAVESKITFDFKYISQNKKKMIEEFCQGLVTFKDANPKKTLESVATHEAAKAKLRQVAQLVREGKTSVLEKGILVPGRIGVGKSYLISCFASECDMPMLELGNFRSQWVGETEKQLSKILLTIKALGPVVVVIDEADAVLGNSRDSNSGDSGIGNRIFAALAAHIGDDNTRGKEIWIAMTSRPDLLAIDMKRQGRFGLCIPLFPAQNGEETKALFITIAKTRGMTLGEAELQAACDAFADHPITGSDAEAMLVRAQEAAVLKGQENPTTAEISEAITSFIDPLDPKLLRLQELAAVLACTDKRFLPTKYEGGDRTAMREELDYLKS